MLCVAVSCSGLCALLTVLQQIVLMAAGCIERNGMERFEVVASRGKISAFIEVGADGM